MNEISTGNFLFSKNRQKLAKLLPSHGLAIVVSNDEMPRTGDQFFPFRQNSDLFYLTGINQPKTLLFICPDMHDRKLREVLLIERPTERQLLWMGSRLTADAASAVSGIQNVLWLDEFEKTLNELMLYARYVYLSFHENARRFDEVPLRDFRFTEKIKTLFPLHKYERLSPLMAGLREIKEEEEIVLIKQAIQISCNAFFSFAKVVAHNAFEYEVEAAITASIVSQGASGHAFQPIVASGANACVLHYHTNRAQLMDGELLLVDFGAELLNYNADITRVLPVSGTFTTRQAEVYNAVLRIHNAALQYYKPGYTIERIHQSTIPYVEAELVNLKLVTNDDLKKQDPEKPLYKTYIMHGIAHFLGLDVHDVGQKTDVLVAGMVITCEPGIYIKEEGVGIRLENDILITPDGHQNVSSAIPIEIADIEKMMLEMRRR